MFHAITEKKKSLVILFIISFIVVLSIREIVDPLFAIVMIMWACTFTYSILNIKDSPLLLCFLIAFFVFLLGRQFCYHYLHMEQAYQFLDVTNNETYICLIISFLGIWIGLGLSGKMEFARTAKVSFLENERYNRGYKSVCITVFYLCYMGAVLATILQIIFVQRVGYVASYTEGAGGADIPAVISYLSRFMPIALCLFLATKPSKKEALFPLILYEINAVLTLLTGQRYPFIGASMFVLIYYILRSRDENVWMKKYHYVFLIIAIPVLLLFLNAYDSIRLGNSYNMDSYLKVIREFFILQGGSINVIRRTIYNADQLKDMHLVSFSNIYSTVFENVISRRIFNTTTYTGNSIARAMNSNSLAHRLSYIAYGDAYLVGFGTGSSYIAELLHDFSLAGVFIGNIIYGIVIRKIDKIAFSDRFYDGVKLAMIYYLLFAPRANFDSFIGNVFNLFSVVGFAALIFLTKLYQQLPASVTERIKMIKKR